MNNRLTKVRLPKFLAIYFSILIVGSAVLAKFCGHDEKPNEKR